MLYCYVFIFSQQQLRKQQLLKNSRVKNHNNSLQLYTTFDYCILQFSTVKITRYLHAIASNKPCDVALD